MTRHVAQAFSIKSLGMQQNKKEKSIKFNIERLWDFVSFSVVTPQIPSSNETKEPFFQNCWKGSFYAPSGKAFTIWQILAIELFEVELRKCFCSLASGSRKVQKKHPWPWDPWGSVVRGDGWLNQRNAIYLLRTRFCYFTGIQAVQNNQRSKISPFDLNHSTFSKLIQKHTNVQSAHKFSAV